MGKKLIFEIHFEATFAACLDVSLCTYTTSQKRWLMKTQLFKLSLFAHKINRQHIQFAFALLALVLLVLGAGAPTDSALGGR